IPELSKKMKGLNVKRCRRNLTGCERGLYTRRVDRRMFLQVAAATPLLGAPVEDPKYKVVTPFKPAAKPGMPGPYPGQVVRVHSENSINADTGQVNRDVVKQMLSSGMRALTGDAREEDAWARFISPKDVVGIKVNCSGAPRI